MAILIPDKTTTCGGVKVNEYLLTKHNPNRISMPNVSMKDRVIGVTVHNTDWINVASNTTPAEQYTRATVNGNMNDVRVHYYVDDKCAWHNLPLDLIGWHAADGSGNGNRRTIAIECIMSSRYNDKDKASEDNCAKLSAYLLYKYGLGIEHLYTHTHWLNVKAGKTGTVDKLNTMYNSYKNCPAYIIPHWQTFKNKVAKYLDELNGVKETAKPVTKPTTTTQSTSTTTAKTMYVKTNGGVLFVRDGQSVDCTKLGELANGTKVTVYATKNGWSKISKTEEKWVSSAYLTATAPKTEKKITYKTTVNTKYRLKKNTKLYSNGNLTGTVYDYLAKTEILVLNHHNENVDKVKVVKTGRVAYCKVADFT